MAKFEVISRIIDVASGKFLVPGAILEIDETEKERIQKAKGFVKIGVLKDVEEVPEPNEETEPEPEKEPKQQAKKAK